MILNQIDVARRLLRFSIKGYVQKYDPLVVHLCAQSALRICRDKLKHDLPEREILGGFFVKDLRPFLRDFSKLNNFLKHGEHGPDQIIVENIDDKNASLIYLTCRYFRERFEDNREEATFLWFQAYRIKLDPLHKPEQILDLDPDLLKLSSEDIFNLLENEFEFEGL